MPSAKGKFVRMLGGLLLKRGSVARVDDVGSGFRRLEVSGDFEQAAPGAKVQLLLPSDDVRTYTPIASASGAGSMTLLGWTRAGGPGARWIVDARQGTELRFAGPDRSLDLPSGPVVLVGDETSVAVAASYDAARPGDVRAILAGNSRDDLAAASASVGLSPAYLAARGDTQAVVGAVVEMHAALPGAIVAVTGGAELVMSVREALRGRGLRNVKTKTYWVPGKTGLD